MADAPRRYRLSHRGRRSFYAGWTIERIRADARLIGPATVALCELILGVGHIQNGAFGPIWGSLGWPVPYGTGRLEAAANRAIEIGARTYGSVKSILDNHLDRRPAQKRATESPIAALTSARL